MLSYQMKKITVIHSLYVFSLRAVR